MKELLNHRVTQTEFASLLGIDQSTVSRLISDGWLAEDGTCIQWLHQYTGRLREQAAGRMGDTIGGLDPAQESAALKRSQREGQEIRNKKERGEFAAIGVLAEAMATASQSVVERFEQLPGQLKKSCPDLSDEAREQAMVTIASARNEWVRNTEQLVAKRLAAYAEDYEDIEGEEE